MSTLFLSLWAVELDNLPLGTVFHERIDATEVAEVVSDARNRGSLICVSDDDLLAPYNEHERRRHKIFREALASFGVRLSLNDFLWPHDGGPQSTNTLTGVELRDGDRLLVATCLYVLDDRSGRGGDTEGDGLSFSIDPSSVEFHLIEAARDAYDGRRHRATLARSRTQASA